MSRFDQEAEPTAVLHPSHRCGGSALSICELHRVTQHDAVWLVWTVEDFIWPGNTCSSSQDIPCQGEGRLSLASLLGRVDPWYNSRWNRNRRDKQVNGHTYSFVRLERQYYTYTRMSTNNSIDNRLDHSKYRYKHIHDVYHVQHLSFLFWDANVC